MNLFLLCICATLTLALPIQFAFTGDTPTIRVGPSGTIKPSPIISPVDEQHPTPRPTFREYVERLRSGRPSSSKGLGPDPKWPTKSESQNDQTKVSDRKYGTFLGSPSKPSLVEQDQASSSSSPPTQRYGVLLGKFNKFVELHGPKTHSIDSKPLELHSEPDSSLGRLYGTFLGGMDNLMPSESHPKNALAKSRQKGLCESSKRVLTYLKPSNLFDTLETHGPECVALAIFVLFPLAYLVLELIEMAMRRWTREEYPQRGRERVRLLGPERQLRAWSNQQREMILDEKQWWQTRRARS